MAAALGMNACALVTIEIRTQLCKGLVKSEIQKRCMSKNMWLGFAGHVHGLKNPLFLLIQSYSNTSCSIDLKDLLTSLSSLPEPLTTPPAMPTKQLWFQASEEMPCRVAVQQLGKQVIINNNNNNSKPFSGHSPMSNDLLCLKECLDFFIHQKMQSVTAFEQNACRKWCPLSVEHKHYPWAWECRLWGWLETKSREKVQKSKSLLDFSMFFPSNVASKMVETSIFCYFMMWSWSSPSILLGASAPNASVPLRGSMIVGAKSKSLTHLAWICLEMSRFPSVTNHLSGVHDTCQLYLRDPAHVLPWRASGWSICGCQHQDLDKRLEREK